MKKITTFIAVTLIAASIHAQTGSKTPEQTTTAVAATTPAVVKDEAVLTIKETEFDFGKIPQGKPVTHIFDVVNKGSVPLKISNVQASCGCTTPEWDREKVVAPGETTKITVGYNAAAEGPFAKPITITYNEAQTRVITIKGEVWKTPAASAPENKGANDLKN